VDELSVERASEILDGVGRIRVLVVGDLMIDRYVSGSVDRISPEAPVPVVQVEDEHFAIGGAGNVAANVAALGAECVVVGCVGDDVGAHTMRRALEEQGVSVEGLVVADRRPTTVKTRVTSRRQQIVRFDHEDESDVPTDVAEQLAGRIGGLAARCDVLIMEDYNKGVLVEPVIRAVLRSARDEVKPTVVDPKRRNFFAYEGVTVFKPNAKELADALGTFIHPDDPEWMEATRRELGCRNLLLTLGDRGIALQSGEGGHARVPTVARSVYDVSGAGDTVTAVVAAALAAGGTAAEAAVIANHAAAVEVSKSGVATVTPDEILQHVRSHDP
jgi:rfaE bifunctional protein kinase chain/domain